MRKTQKLTYPVYTIMNKQDMKTMIRNFLAPWKGLKIPESTHVYHFTISRYELVHQLQLDILIQIYCPNVQFFNSDNHQLFLDHVHRLIQD